MEIDAANVPWHKIFLWEAKFRRQKILDIKKQIAVYRRDLNTRS